MEMHERIKNVRKNNNMTQHEFAERLGVTRSVISNIELDRLAKPEQKASLIKLISKEFNVNEDWLLNGVEPMFLPTVNDLLKQLAQTHNFTDMEYKFLYEYLKLDLGKRQAVVEFLENIMNSDASLISTKPTPKVISSDENVTTKEEITTSPNKTAEQLEEEYKKNLLRNASEQAATVSNITEEDEKRKAQ